MTLVERAQCYQEAFPAYPQLCVDKGWLYGVWLIGNYYKNASGLYGAYPHSYLKRILSLFPDKQAGHILHLFSGSLGPDVPGVRLDLKYGEGATPNVIGDAEHLSTYFEKGWFDLILADPPYSEEDAVHYGTPMVNRNKVIAECEQVLAPGGFLVWLDQVFPMYRKASMKLVGTIGLIRSTNHRVRSVFIWERAREELRSR